MTMENEKQEIFDQINLSMEEQQEYIENILGYDFVCHPDVFSPKYFASIQVFNAGFFFKQNDHFLEIGLGIGVIFVLAAKSYNNKVVSIDINPTAVRITDINANRHGVGNKVDVRQGDLFSAINRGEKFNTVFWDFPFVFLPESYNFSSDLYRSFFDPGYATLKRFLAQVKEFLTDNGRIILTFSSLGDRAVFDKISSNMHYTFDEVYRKEVQGIGEFMLLQHQVS